MICTPGGGAWGSAGGEKKLKLDNGRAFGKGDARGSVHERGEAMEGV